MIICYNLDKDYQCILYNYLLIFIFILLYICLYIIDNKLVRIKQTEFIHCTYTL